MKPDSPPRRGEPWALATALGYASANIFDGAAVKLDGPYIGPLFRGLPSLVLGIILMWKHRTLNQLRPSSPQYIGLRPILAFVSAGVISTVGLLFYYLAMNFGGVIITVPVQETYVIWGTLIAWLVLGERLHRFAFVGIVVLLFGLVTLSLGQLRGQPISPHWYWAIPMALSTALSYGIAGVLWRDGQLRGAHQSVAIFLQFTTSVVVALVELFVTGQFAAMHTASGRAIAALLASGVLSGVLAIYCMFTALRLMAVARVYAFSSLTPLIATLFAHFWLHEFVNGLMLGGIVLVSIGVVLTHVFRPPNERQAD